MMVETLLLIMVVMVTVAIIYKFADFQNLSSLPLIIIITKNVSYLLVTLCERLYLYKGVFEHFLRCISESCYFG